jgi:CBS-domain-containing membrane protein
MWSTWFKTIGSYLNKIVPKQYESPLRFQLIASLSIGLGLFSILFFNSQFLALENENLYLCLPFLGTCSLIFLTPSSKTSQPLPVIFGYISNTLLGIICVNLLSNPGLEILLTIILCLGLMRVTGLIHIPALLIIPVITFFQTQSYSYVFMPIFFDALILVLLGMLLNPLMHKKYPYKASS